MIELLHADCMTYLAELPDKAFDLLICDPPYGLGNRLSDGGGKLKDTPMAKLYRESSKWDVLPSKYFWEQVFRVSKNQIVFGANYFIEHLKSSRGIVCWDKLNSMPTMSAWEMVWTSFDKPAKIFVKNSQDLDRFHPTQKPVALYKWLLQNYAKHGDRILDTHGGSFSHAIAAYDLGFDLTIMEIDEDYYKAGKARFDAHVAKYAPASEQPVTMKGELKLF